MKKLWHYLLNHLKSDFQPRPYLYIAAFLALSIALNYYFDFEDNVIDRQQGILKFCLFFSTHAGAYFIPVLILKAFRTDSIKLNGQFWIRSVLALALLSADRSLLLVETYVFKLLDARVFLWGFKVINNLAGLLYIMLPLYIFYKLKDKRFKNFYGLSQGSSAVLKPYLIILATMLPVIVAASFLPGFQKQYPMYITTTAHSYLGIPEWLTVAGYELAYALNFVTIEFFYRGFLVLGMLACLGRSAILPMACLYCSLHFGKPMPEAISSIFGGYILGVFAYETKSIWGGVVVHVGIAWMMEIAAFIQSLSHR